MAAVCDNERCELDFEELKLTVSVQTLLDAGAVNAEGFYLHCPACKERTLVHWEPYQLFLWREDDKQKFYRWRTSPIKLETFRKPGQRDSVYHAKLGQLTLEFAADMIGEGGDNFSEERICYRTVPVFRDHDDPNGVSLPALPVKKEFLDLVDTSREIQKPQLTGKGEYRFRFHLHMRKEQVDIVRPSMKVQSAASSASSQDPIIEGVHLTLWPKTSYAAWRRYFLRFGCAKKEDAEKLFNDNLNVVVSAAEVTNLSKTKWLPLERDQFTQYTCVESRPGWIAVEFEDKQRQETVGNVSRQDVVGGGVWKIPAASDSYPTGETTLGIDFGTSNTCIAWHAASGIDLLPIEQCDHFIIRGSDLPKQLTTADIWLPRQGFGRNRALLPTEILMREKIGIHRSRGKEVEAWKPVVDYSIPTSGVESLYNENEHIVADFKWQNMIANEWFANSERYKDLQIKYIELLLLLAMARLAMSGNIGESLNVMFSYPLAFDTKMQDDFRLVLSAAATNVSQQTGVTVRPELKLDEARAAANSTEDPGIYDSACLYVDIGGGSTDIALLELRAGKNGQGRYDYVCSFQYAGGALATALVEGDCLKPGKDISHFRRQIREKGNVTDVLNSKELFSTNKEGVITSKSGYFYAYLRQFLSRLLAAHIINKHLLLNETPAPEASESAQADAEKYRVVLYPMGNGWGFGNFIAVNYATEAFCQRLSVETNAIIKEAVARKIVSARTPEVLVEGKPIKNPKNAVAFGLIGKSDGNQPQQEWPWRSILGWTTQAGRVQKVEWFSPVTGGNATPPPNAESIPQRVQLDCPKDEWPAFPSKLPAPHDFDEDLSSIRRDLVARCSPNSSEHEWFIDSPFHVILEKLIKPKLKELI
jgi:hypothetical protein